MPKIVSVSSFSSLRLEFYSHHVPTMMINLRDFITEKIFPLPPKVCIFPFIFAKILLKKRSPFSWKALQINDILPQPGRKRTSHGDSSPITYFSTRNAFFVQELLQKPYQYHNREQNLPPHRTAPEYAPHPHPDLPRSAPQTFPSAIYDRSA